MEFFKKIKLKKGEKMKENHYEVVIIGGGISGSAAAYVLARYTDIKSIAIVEKYEGLSTLNSKCTANSQTIHCGDIETNYTYEKAAVVSKKANMISKYGLQHGLNEKHMFAGQKMAIGVGDEECEKIKARYEEFKTLYPYLEFFDKETLKQIEPKIIFDRDGKERPENVVGMGSRGGQYTTVDYGAFSNSFANNAKAQEGKTCDVYLNSQVTKIANVGGKFYITTKNNLSISADFVLVDAGAHSLYLAHQMGYGLEKSCFPVAGSFYMTKQKLLNGKVYMVQNPKLPFAALHGDPDLAEGWCTRFGPTALVIPQLERYHGHVVTFLEFFKTLRLDSRVISAAFDLLKDSDIRNYILRNFLFEIPLINKSTFIKDVRKIVPSIQPDELRYASGFGGVRPQVVDKIQKKLLLGEASINECPGAIFNMTPSPGATSCLGNAKRDAIEICKYLGKSFNEDKFHAELED